MGAALCLLLKSSKGERTNVNGLKGVFGRGELDRRKKGGKGAEEDEGFR